MTSRSTSDEARRALGETRRFVRAGERRGLRPRWFNFLNAAVLGVWANRIAEQAVNAVHSDGFDTTNFLWVVGCGVLISILETIARRAWGTATRHGPDNWSLVSVVGWISAAVVALLGGSLKAYWGLGWSPWAAGAAVCLIVFAAMESRRRAILSRDAGRLA